MPTKFLELLDLIGIEPEHYHDPDTGELKDHPNADEPGPLVSEGCAFAVPTMVDGKIVRTTRHVKIVPSDTPISTEPSPVALDSDVTTTARIIPGTRQIECGDELVVDALLQGGYRLVDPPKSQHVARGRKSGEKTDDEKKED